MGSTVALILEKHVIAEICYTTSHAARVRRLVSALARLWLLGLRFDCCWMLTFVFADSMFFRKTGWSWSCNTVAIRDRRVPKTNGHCFNRVQDAISSVCTGCESFVANIQWWVDSAASSGARLLVTVRGSTVFTASVVSSYASKWSSTMNLCHHVTLHDVSRLKCRSQAMIQHVARAVILARSWNSATTINVLVNTNRSREYCTH